MVAVATIAASEAATSTAQSASTTAVYSFNHGSSEPGGGASTTARLPATLRYIEQLTRPLTVTDALNSPAVAHGIAAEQFEEEEEHADTHNSVGNSKLPELGNMNGEQLRIMHDKIIKALRDRGELSAPQKCVDVNAGATLEGTVSMKAQQAQPTPPKHKLNQRQLTPQRVP